MKHGRFGNFLDEAKDWNLSRDRFWGTPLPVWRCRNNHVRFIGSRKEIEEMGATVPQDLHRPYIDEVKFVCPDCGEEMRREPYVIDTWFDSGSATYAAMHYPFEDNFDPSSDLPVSFITEAIDQTRGWFYVLHVISTIMFNKNAYDSALSISFILDEQGRKMSKSKGNSVFALDYLKQVAPDSLRLFFLYGAPWKSKNLDRKIIDEVSRRVISTLLNVYSFFAYNANIDGFEFKGILEAKDTLDKWLISKINTFIIESRRAYDDLDFHEVVRLSMDFVDNLSNFYLRLSRRRFWAEDVTEDKLAAYSTLYTAIMTCSKVLAPIVPFVSDYLYLSLHGPYESIHLDSFPEPDTSKIDHDLEKRMDQAYSVIETVRRIRQEINIKGRQPVKEILLSGNIDPEIIPVVSQEVNAKEIRIVSSEQRPLKYTVDLKMETAAPILRSSVNSVREALKSIDGKAAFDAVQNGGKLRVLDHELTGEMLNISTIPDPDYGYSRDEKNGIDVFVNKRIDRNEYLEGLAREIVRRIQLMRKEMNLDYTDRINVWIDPVGDFSDAIDKFESYIKAETQCDSLNVGHTDDLRKWEIGDETIGIRIEKVVPK